MNDLIILGAGGLGQEIAWLVEEINDARKEWNLIGFLDDYLAGREEEILGYPVLGSYADIGRFPNARAVVAFGDAQLRRRVVTEVQAGGTRWATLISPTVRVHRSHTLGEGVVVGRYTDFTVGCRIGSFVMLNIHVVLGHAVTVGDFTIVSPNVTINGGATIGQACQIGANAFIREVTLGDNVVVGASSCVTKSVEPDCVVAGVPAKILHQGRPNTSISRSERE